MDFLKPIKQLPQFLLTTHVVFIDFWFPMLKVIHFKLNIFLPGNGWCVSKSLTGTIKTCKPQGFPLELVFAITRDVLVVFPTLKQDNII